MTVCNECGGDIVTIPLPPPSSTDRNGLTTTCDVYMFKRACVRCGMSGGFGALDGPGRGPEGSPGGGEGSGRGVGALDDLQRLMGPNMLVVRL